MSYVSTTFKYVYTYVYVCITVYIDIHVHIVCVNVCNILHARSYSDYVMVTNIQRLSIQATLPGSELMWTSSRH
jgi:hypothetical protein